MVTVRNGTCSTDVIVAGKTPIEVEILIECGDECDVLELTINYLRMKITANITKRQQNNRYTP